jgi:hypothetical protein
MHIENTAQLSKLLNHLNNISAIAWYGKNIYCADVKQQLVSNNDNPE